MIYKAATLLIVVFALLTAGVPVANASVNDTVGIWADKLRQPLLVKKVQLQKEIETVSQKEAEVTQTQIGMDINEAVGAGTVKASRPVGSPTDTLLRLAMQVYLFFVIVAVFILEHRIVLYIVLALILYKLIRWVFGRFFIRTI